MLFRSNLQINDAIVAEGAANVPESGYDVSSYYVKPLDGNLQISDSNIAIAPSSTINGYLTGSTSAPNGLGIGSGISFPTSPTTGEYFLRTDYLPNRLFQFNGTIWAAINDVQRANITQGANNNTLLGGFVNNPGTFVNNDGATVNLKQSLSTVLTPKADN